MSQVESAEGRNYIHAGGKGWVEAEWAGNMQEAIQRVRELHKPQVAGLEGTFCQECYGDNDFGAWGHYPCETIKALDGEQQ